jgi:hypothetical protein
MHKNLKNLPFGAAVSLAKQGALITRSGWNGKGMFVFLRPADKLNIDTIAFKVKSLPDAVKKYFFSLTDPEKENGIDRDTLISFSEYFCMKAADGSIVNGWLASQTDMLAEDWQVFEII